MADQNKGMSDLWRRLRFVFMAIVVYRLGTHIPIPGIDPARLAALFDQNQGTILEMFNLFSGGALERMSIFALNVVILTTLSHSFLDLKYLNISTRTSSFKSSLGLCIK